MAIQVILIENYPSLGYVGDVVQVKSGYARNYLIPRNIAVEASSTNGKLMKHRMQGIQAKRNKMKTEAQAFGEKLQTAALAFTLKAGEAGKSFGAVTARDIEAAFKAQGFEINRKQIRLLEPLKVAGSYRVDIKVHADVMVSVPVSVQTEAPKKEARDADAAAGKKKPAKSKAKQAAETTEEAPTEGTDAE